MDPESSDILGGRLPVVRHEYDQSWSLAGKLYFTLGAGLVLWLCWLRVGPYWRQYREKQYRKAMRRRHGIPDNDHRPFNVAYAAATRARQEAEAGVKRSRRTSMELQAWSHTSSHLYTVPTNNARQRYSQSDFDDMPSNDSPIYATQRSMYTGEGNHLGESSTLRTPNHYSDQFPDPRPGSLRERSTRRSRLSTLPAYGKHALDEEDEQDDGEKELKKSRVEGDEQFDGNEDAGWEEEEDAEDSGMEVDEEAHTAASRGSKRSAGGDEEDDVEAGQSSKRVRKVSRSKPHDIDQDMEDADDVQDLPSIPRGKKRDRGEAGSGFGGNESVVDEDEGKPRRHTRRRTVSHKKSSVSSRGQKRGRETADSEDSDDGDSAKPMKRSMRQKHAQSGTDESDLSMDDGMISHDPLCKGRRIGEEWEVNGILYKVGPNGQRLRQALVKRSRSRFPMPKDSEHPDRSANISVFVETWLSEEQYQEAKERQELAWQESPRQTTAEPETPGDVEDFTPAKPGKNLLWSTTKDSPVPQRRPFRQSISSVGLRINPFEQPQIPPGRRISSVQLSPMLPPDSPKLHSSRSYSKWEKQDLEAIAMAKLREKSQKQHAPPAPEQPVIPSFTPVANGSSDKKEPAPPAVNGLFQGPAATTSGPSSQAKADTPAPAAPAVASAPFSFAKPSASSQPSKTSSISFPAAPAATPSSGSSDVKPSVPTAAPTSPAPPFSFAAPSTAKPPAPVPVAAASSSRSSVPNFFSQPTTASAPTAAGVGGLSNPFTPKVGSVTPTPGSNVSSPAAAPAFSFPKPSAPVTAPPTNNGTVPTAQSTTAPLFSFKAPSSGPSQPAMTQPSSSPFGASHPGQFAQAKSAEPSAAAGFSLFGAAEETKPTEATSAPAGGSLFARLGPQPATTVAPAAFTPATTANNAFTFGKPAAPAPTAAGDTKAVVNTSASTSSAAAPVKFNFFGSNANSSNPTPATASATTNVNSAGTPNTGNAPVPSNGGFAGFGSTSNGPAPSSTPFGGFGTAKPAATGSGLGFAPVSNAPDASKPAYSFAFGSGNGSSATPAAPSPFGGSAAGTSTFGSAPPPPAPTFGKTASSNGSTNPPQAAPAQSAFGSFGSTPFGTGASTTTASPFGASNGTPAPALKSNEASSKPSFSFNFGAPPSTNGTATPAFGAPSSTNGTPTPAFGAPADTPPTNGSQPSLTSFGFGNPTSSTNTSAFTFGAPSKQK